MEKYLAEDWYNPTIKTVIVERETNSSFWVNGNCRRKSQSESELFDSFDEAKQYLIKRHKRRVGSAEVQLSNAQKTLKLVVDLML